MSYRSSCGRNTDYAIPFVFWSQYRLCYNVRVLVTIQSMLYRSSCVRNTDYAIPFVFWSQYRLCYTFGLMVTIPSMLYRSSCGHNTDYAIPFVFWSQYSLCYTVRLVVTITTMLYRSCFGHSTDYDIGIPCSTANLKSMRTVRKVQITALSSATLFDSAALNVLPGSSYYINDVIGRTA